MYIPKSLLAVCSKDPSRPALRHVYVDTTHPCAVATDRYHLVVCPVVLTEDDVSGYVPREAILAAHALPKKHPQRGEVAHGTHTTTVCGTEAVYTNPFSTGTADTVVPRYPDWQGCVPKEPGTLLVQTAFNWAHLDNIASVLYERASAGTPRILVLSFFAETLPIIRVTMRSPSPTALFAWGLIMSVKLP